MSLARDVSEIIRNHIARAEGVKTHPAKLMVLSNLLKELFGVELEELLPGVEAKLKSKIWGLRGRADLVFSNVVFEVKVDLKRELDDAKGELIKYLQILHEQEPGRVHIGIATDAIEFRAFIPTIKEGQVVELREIGSLNLAKSDPSESFLWLDSFIFSQTSIRPSAQDLRWRFGPGSPTYSVAKKTLEQLWHEVENERDVKLKLDLWAKNMEIVYGSKPELGSFIDHTYLVSLVKLIVYLRLSGSKVVTKNEVRKALTGEYFSSLGIANLIEEDFFAWIMHPKISNKTLKLFHDLAKELLRYDFTQIDEDFFKEIYQEIVERGQRHRIGEYYTPEWLAQMILEDAIKLWREKNQGLPRILDPACGSGTFLSNAIHMIRDELEREGKQPDEILDFIINNVVGVDINPLAAIIARANYLIALGNLLQLGRRIIIPIYIADSIRIPKALATLTEGTQGYVDVYEVNANGHPIQIPKKVVLQKGMLSQVLQALKEAANAYKTYKKRDVAFKVFRRRLPEQLSNSELKVLETTLSTIMKLIDEGLDSVWIFILNNVYAPIALRESKFDLVVGNPPWIAMRYIENKSYQDFIKEQVFRYKLLNSDQTHLFTQMEIATLFYRKCSDLYLREGGIIAFVMPRSVLTGALHHVNFKRFDVPKMRLVKIYDLEHVKPLFNVPSCVLIAVKGEETTYPVPAIEYSGELPEKNVKLSEAVKHLSISNYGYEPPEIPKSHYSYYYKHVKAGGCIYPRCFFFVEFEVHPTLGISTKEPLIRTSEEVMEDAKEPWKDIRLEGNVESKFMYATLLGGDILSFGYVKLRPVVLPIEQTNLGYRILDVDELRKDGYVHMAEWLEKAQKHWEEKRTKRAEESLSRVVHHLNYQGSITVQNPRKRYCVVYNSSGKNVASCVIDKQTLPGFQVGKAIIKPTNFVADIKTHFYETDNELEAHYLCAILNSNVVNELIKTFQTKGLYGERDIGRRPFMLPIPEFNENNQLHLKLAELSKQCHKKVASLKLTKKSTAALRKEVREAIKDEIATIDQLVRQLLGGSQAGSRPLPQFLSKQT